MGLGYVRVMSNIVLSYLKALAMHDHLCIVFFFHLNHLITTS